MIESINYPYFRAFSRAKGEAEDINALNHQVLQYVGGKISPEMQTPKILWLKKNERKYYDEVRTYFSICEINKSLNIAMEHGLLFDSFQTLTLIPITLLLLEISHLMDLSDFLTFKSTGSLHRSLCSAVCKWTYEFEMPSGERKGWNDSYFKQIGLGDMAEEGYCRIGLSDQVKL